VYASKVKDQKLTLVVSGQLWNRSLVMMDQETQSLWSHILGECLEGKLKGAELETIPSDMLSWAGWKKEHPETTVLDMKRTSKNYTKEFYRSPNRFVVGYKGNFGMHHTSFASMKAAPLQNIDAKGLPLLLVFDSKSTSAKIFKRKLDAKVLSFVAQGDSELKDIETGSVWSRKTGTAISGPNKGKQLQQHVGIVSYRQAWNTFHPTSRETKPPAKTDK
jgi:hypothetical protein